MHLLMWRMQSNILNGFLCIFIRCFDRKSPYLLCENQPLDARARARAYRRAIVLVCAHNCSVQFFFLFFSLFHSFAQSNPTEIGSTFHVFISVFIQTQFLCLFAMFKLASVQYYYFCCI